MIVIFELKGQSQIMNATIFDINDFIEKYYNSLTYLDFDGGNVSVVNKFPPHLRHLSCSHNQLYDVPELPINLEYFDCSNNNLNKLPTLPKKLKYLYCQNNKLTIPPQPYSKLIDCISDGNKYNSDITSGSYGIVNISVHSDGNPIVTKTMDLEQYGTLNEIAFMNSFLTEIMNDHCFFPKLYDMFIDYDQCIVKLSMNYCGISLSKYNPNLETKLGLLPTINRDMASALYFLSEHKIIHMDIKLDNICINPDRDNEIKLIDFGLAIPVTDKILNHIGTYIYADIQYHYPCVHYTSSDVYSFGMSMLFWLIDRANEHNISRELCKNYSKIVNNFYENVVENNDQIRSKLLSTFPTYSDFIQKFQINECENEYIMLYGKMISYDPQYRPVPNRNNKGKFIDIYPDMTITDYEQVNTNSIARIIGRSYQQPEVTSICCDEGSLDKELEWHFSIEALYGVECCSSHHLNNMKKYYENGIVSWERLFRFC